MGKREMNQFTTEVNQPLMGERYTTEFPDNTGPVPCCGCCCRCDDGWYCGTVWRTANNITWLIVTILTIVAITIAIVFWPSPCSVDFDLLPGDQALFCPPFLEHQRHTTFVTRNFDCIANLTTFEGDLSDKNMSVINTSFTIEPAWVSAGEHVARSFYLSPNSQLSWTVTATYPSTANIPVDAKTLADDDLPRYILFKSRTTYEKYREGGLKVSDRTAVKYGTIKSTANDDMKYTVPKNAMDEYIFVLEARKSSAYLSAVIAAKRQIYDPKQQPLANSSKINGINDETEYTYKLGSRCVLLQNLCKDGTNQSSSVLTKRAVVGVHYDTDDLNTTINLLSTIGLIVVVHLILVTIFCCCGYCRARARNNAKPNIFKDSSYSPSIDYDY